MRSPIPLSPSEMEQKPRIVPAIRFEETQNPAEIEANVKAWVAENGPYTHCLLWCGPQVITTSGQPTSVAVPKLQEVVPCDASGADILPITAALWGARKPLDALPYLSYCLLPLACATGKADDDPWFVRMKKLGATKMLVQPPSKLLLP